jgi:predicted nucleic acid-binding protein
VDTRPSEQRIEKIQNKKERKCRINTVQENHMKKGRRRPTVYYG